MCQRMAGRLTEMKKTAGRSGWASGYPGGGGRRRGGYPGGGGGPISWWRPNQHESSQGIQGLRHERYGFETRRPMQRDGKRNIVDITATSVQNSVGFLQWWPYIDLREVTRHGD